jgi:hypothetical protein
MAFIQYRPDTPEGRDAQLQAIAIITAGLDSPELLQRELAAAIGPKPDARAWTLLTIALGQVGIKMTALAAAMDAQSAEVVSGHRDPLTPFDLLRNWARLIIEEVEPPPS